MTGQGSELTAARCGCTNNTREPHDLQSHFPDICITARMYECLDYYQGPEHHGHSIPQDSSYFQGMLVPEISSSAGFRVIIACYAQISSRIREFFDFMQPETDISKVFG